MSTKTFIFGQAFDHQTSVATIPRDYICDTYAERPTSGLIVGSRLFAVDTAKLYRATDTTTWTEVGGGAAAADPSYSPGSFTIETETGRVQPKTLQLTGAQVATIQGTGRLVICG